MNSSLNRSIKSKATLRILSDSLINIRGIFATSIKYWIWTIIKTNLTLISTFLQSIGSCCPARTLWSRPICILTVLNDNQHIWGDFFNRYLWHLALSCYKIILGSLLIYFVAKETKTEKEKERGERREREQFFVAIIEQTSAMREVRVLLGLSSVRFAAYVSTSMRRALSIEASFVISIYSAWDLGLPEAKLNIIRSFLLKNRSEQLAKCVNIAWVNCGIPWGWEYLDLSRVSNDI